MSRLHRLAAAPLLTGALLTAPAVIGLGAVVPTAVAHDALVGATPADGAVLDSAPDQIELVFSATPRGTYDTVALSRDGEVLLSETPVVDGNVLTVEIPDELDLTDGTYTVGYQITSSDGHATRGSYTFSLSTGGTATSGSTDVPTGTDDSDADDTVDGLPSWGGPLLGIAGVLVLAGVLVMLIARLRHSGK
ncbi:copper resistance CopC family protein [Corynebacterium terpenotabidum]|uniref:CopC domain-containing protein n=1 Tax=Corynebacterium terpenotabidum Y-11 TaxID=1200352 RepID=S4XCM8_9CORY|nr:copper resistance protein CopC [Corynebacterium terpenotabidum]AGP30887.1 hypothetical protein A606_06200 [Corynebacterium terpenotabidum Y-11]